MENQIANLKLQTLSPDGIRSDSVIVVGAPSCEADGTWACEIEISGLGKLDIKHKFYGGDSLQALCVGLHYVRTALEHCAKTRKIFFPGESERWPFEAYFPDAWTEHNHSETN